MNKLITISGTHGTGKTTILNLINKELNWGIGIDRALNPFQTTYQAMLFFVSSFSLRDKNALEVLAKENIIIDRWSLIDIEAYIEVFENINYLSVKEKNAISLALNTSDSKRIKPRLAILLDSKPETILDRLKKFRTPSKHHIHERDFKALSAIRNTFLKKFKQIKDVETMIISTDGKSPMEIVEEIKNHKKFANLL
jgi:thymidylate kinase